MSLRSWIAPAVLIVVGTAQMAGDLLGVQALKALGAATGASPAPKVFTAHQGFETYSSEFFISWSGRDGSRQVLKLTPAVYGGIRGPYNRRNAYGAALSYAPVLQSSEHTRDMLESVLRYTFCGPSTILEELGIERGDVAGPFMVELKPRQALPADHAWKLHYEIACDAQ